MALDTTQGKDVALVRNDATGRWDLDFQTSGPSKGNPRLSSDGTHAVLTTLLSWKRGTRPGAKSAEGGYYYDPQNRRGTLLWTVSMDRMSTPSQLKAYADDGGQQLLDLKMIGSFSSSATRVRAGRFRVDFSWTTPDALRTAQQLSLPL